MHTILVLGGYGFFGKRIADCLIGDAGIQLLIGGRNLEKAEAACAELGLPRGNAILINAQDPAMASLLSRSGVETLIHTAGPFQMQDYGVARIAITAGCNYIDLADGRQFVAGIAALDDAAKKRGVTVISGASSVPGLSSAVVDRYLGEFSRLDEIRIGIGSGGRAPGLATVAGIFGYCGKPIRRLENGRWTETFGWLDLTRYRFADPVGVRLLGSCDVPDLELFPMRYPSVKTVTFHAGFASKPGHLLVWFLSGLVKLGLLRNLSPWARPLRRMSHWMESMVSDKGAMFVELDGIGRDERPLCKRWNLIALQNHGPYIPCGASIALARKLAAGIPMPPGAMACMGLLSVDEYLAPLRSLDILEVPA
jgi:saccharopine dehydrogenase-like NADP-dependent oxidoreductase